MYSCQENKKKEHIERAVEYLFVGNSRDVIQTFTDTIEFTISNSNDSIYVYKLKTRIGPIQYSIDYLHEEMVTVFPDEVSSKSFILDKRTIKLCQPVAREYKIYKALTVQSDSSTIGVLYFWVPEFGIILRRAVNFGGFTHSLDNLFYRTEPFDNNINRDIVRELCFSIFSNIYSDTDFYSLSKQEFNSIIHRNE